MTVSTFEFAGMWLAKDGNFIAFGNTLDAVIAAVNDPNSHEELIVHFSEDEYRILSEFVIAQEGRRPTNGDPLANIPLPSDPTAGVYSVLSPAGRRYGTWSIMKQSTRNKNTWDTVMPDVGSRETAERLVGLLNSQGPSQGPALKVAQA